MFVPSVQLYRTLSNPSSPLLVLGLLPWPPCCPRRSVAPSAPSCVSFSLPSLLPSVLGVCFVFASTSASIVARCWTREEPGTANGTSSIRAEESPVTVQLEVVGDDDHDDDRDDDCDGGHEHEDDGTASARWAARVAASLHLRALSKSLHLQLLPTLPGWVSHSAHLTSARFSSHLLYASGTLPACGLWNLWQGFLRTPHFAPFLDAGGTTINPRLLSLCCPTWPTTSVTSLSPSSSKIVFFCSLPPRVSSRHESLGASMDDGWMTKPQS